MSDHAIAALHKYYVRAQHMRLLAARARKAFEAKFGAAWKQHSNTTEYFQSQMYLDYWYSTIFTVSEGYEKLGLSDPVVEKLIKQPLYSELRKYRAGTYHFDQNYFTPSIRAFLNDRKATNWLVQFDMALGRYLLTELRKRSRLATFRKTLERLK